jgi:predicted negative regulator of RcsB-dependent stress response
MKNASKKTTLTDAFVGGGVLIIGITFAGWWVSDRVVNREYYAALDSLEAPIKAKYQDMNEKFSAARRNGVIRTEIEETAQIKKQNEQSEYAELQQAKAIVDRQFGRRE